MSEEKKFNEEKFSAALNALNSYLKENDQEEIVLEGVDAEVLTAKFIEAILAENEKDKAQDLPAEVIEYYNEYIVGDDDEEEEEKPKKKEKKKKEKKEKKPRKTIEKDEYGCSMTSGAHKINLMLAKGAKINDIIEGVGTTRSRVMSHMGSLKSKGFFIDNIDGVFYLLTEEPPERPKPEKPKKEKKEKKEKKPAEKKPAEKKKASSKKTSSKKASSKKTSSKKG